MIEVLFSSSAADGDVVSPILDRNHERKYYSIVFYSDASLTTPVTPTGGTITFTASEDGTQYGDVASFAADTAGVNSTYTRPSTGGLLRFLKVNMASITGASFYQVRVSQYQYNQ